MKGGKSSVKHSQIKLTLSWWIRGNAYINMKKYNAPHGNVITEL